jgi:uncharacterized membrane protein (UPF0127 family)
VTLNQVAHRLALRVGLAAFLLLGLCDYAAPQGMSFEKLPLTVMTQSGRHEFIVDVATNTSQAEFGLRYRQQLRENEGLLIEQSRAAPVPISVSTQNVSLVLDLIFIAGDGTIMEVHANIPPNSATPITSNSPVGGALELAAGSIARFGILPGDKVIGAGFGSS